MPQQNGTAYLTSVLRDIEALLAEKVEHDGTSVERFRALGITAAISVFGDNNSQMVEFRNLDTVSKSEQLPRARALLEALHGEIARRLEHGPPPSVVTYKAMLESFVETIAGASDIPTEEKRGLLVKLGSVLDSKSAQRVVGAPFGAGSAEYVKFRLGRH